MWRICCLAFSLSLVSYAAYSQRPYSQQKNDFLVGGAFDLIKTDNEGFVQKAQVGGEFNYFFARRFAATAGLDIWANNTMSFVFGARCYPIEHFFVRTRGLIGKNDVSIGAGWTKPLGSNFQFEAIGDYYFENEFAIRVGLMYLIRR
jgi:hypothetical protein